MLGRVELSICGRKISEINIMRNLHSMFLLLNYSRIFHNIIDSEIKNKF